MCIAVYSRIHIYIYMYPHIYTHLHSCMHWPRPLPRLTTAPPCQTLTLSVLPIRRCVAAGKASYALKYYNIEDIKSAAAAPAHDAAV